MLLPEFEFHEPLSISEALELKQKLRSSARILAGGTDLLVQMKKKLVHADHLISLLRIRELTEFKKNRNCIKIGACMTMDAIASSPFIHKKFQALRQGALSLGNHLIRNRATIGGNVCNASPAGDTLCPLIVYNAMAILENTENQRQIPVKKLFKGPGRILMDDNEILTGFILPMPAKNCGASYIQLGKRKSSEINLVNVASLIELEPETRIIKKARIALGAVGPTPIRSSNAEKILENRQASEDLFYEAGEQARHSDCSPIDDFRASAAYRKAMAGVLTKRTLKAACKLAQSQ